MSDFKFDCPHCDQHLEAPPELMGEIIECPTCNKRIQLPEPAPRKQSPLHRKGKKILSICALFAMLAVGLAMALFLLNQGERKVGKRLAALDVATLVEISSNDPPSSTTAALIRQELERRGLDAASLSEKNDNSATASNEQTKEAILAERSQPRQPARETSPSPERGLFQGTWTGQSQSGFHVAKIAFQDDTFPCPGEVVTQYGRGQMFRTVVTWTKDGRSLIGTHGGTRMANVTLSSGTLSGEVSPLIAVDGVKLLSFSDFKRGTVGRQEQVATGSAPELAASTSEPARIYRYRRQTGLSVPDGVRTVGVTVETQQGEAGSRLHN